MPQVGRFVTVIRIYNDATFSERDEKDYLLGIVGIVDKSIKGLGLLRYSLYDRVSDFYLAPRAVIVKPLLHP